MLLLIISRGRGQGLVPCRLYEGDEDDCADLTLQMRKVEPSSLVGFVSGVKVVDVEKRNKAGPKHYVFVIQVTWSNPSNAFIIYRRYAQFFDLQCKLLDLFAESSAPSNASRPSRQIPFLPGKIILGRSQTRQVALERKQMLDEYCQALVSLPDAIARSRPVLEFFHPSATDVQKPPEAVLPMKKSVPASELVISGPSKLLSYRCSDDFVASDKLEMSLKRDTIVQVLQKHGNGWWFVQYNDQRGFVPGAFLEPYENQEQDAQGRNTTASPHDEMHVVNEKYVSQSQDELSLDRGSFVTVIEKSFTGWWQVKFNGTTGQFPAVYLTPSTGRYAPDQMATTASPLSVRSTATDKTSNGASVDSSTDSEWDDDDEDDYRWNSSNETDPEVFYAHSDYIDQTGGCLSFQRGDRVEVHRKHSVEWWLGRRVKDEGVLKWIPADFLQKEPILETPIDSMKIEAVLAEDCSTLPHASASPPRQETKASDEPIQNNIQELKAAHVIPAVVPKPTPSSGALGKLKKPVRSISASPSMNEIVEDGQASVKNLVKRFNKTGV